MYAVTPDPIALPLTEASQVGDARRSAVALAAAVGLDDRARADVALVVTEAATNLARHARGGELLFRSVHVGGDAGFEMLAVDRGPGMADLARSLVDGQSTAGTPGTGLGAIARRSDTFDVFTAAAGTVLLSRLWPRPAVPPVRAEHGWLDVGVVCLPVRGEAACGDSWHAQAVPGGRTKVLVADGLGHGLLAAEASRLAVRLFRDHLHLDPVPMVRALHAGLRGTRGAAVAVADLPTASAGDVRFAGVGNVVATVSPADGGRTRSLVSHNGTAGVEARRVQEFAVPWLPGDLLLMHSDGLASRWQLSAYLGLRARRPSTIAAVLYRDFRRDRDDVTVLAVGGPAPARPASPAPSPTPSPTA